MFSDMILQSAAYCNFFSSVSCARLHCSLQVDNCYITL